jgi:hypothetical protein
MREWEEFMAARDILNLNTSIASRLIRCLYIVALILITVMVILGLVRGVRTMMRTPPPPRPAITQNQAGTPAPGAAETPHPPRPGMMNPAQRRMMMMRRFGPRRPMMPFGFGRNPMLAGLWIIFGTLLRGAIGLLVVRILAEMGLAVLAMPRRSEI